MPETPLAMSFLSLDMVMLFTGLDIAFEGS